MHNLFIFIFIILRWGQKAWHSSRAHVFMCARMLCPTRAPCPALRLADVMRARPLSRQCSRRSVAHGSWRRIWTKASIVLKLAWVLHKPNTASLTSGGQQILLPSLKLTLRGAAQPRMARAYIAYKRSEAAQIPLQIQSQIAYARLKAQERQAVEQVDLLWLRATTGNVGLGVK